MDILAGITDIVTSIGAAPPVAIITGVVAAGVGSNILITCLIKLIFSMNNIDYIANWIDAEIDKIEKTNKASAQELKKKIIKLAKQIQVRLSD